MAGLYIPDIEIAGPRGGAEFAVVYEARISIWDDGRMTLEFPGGEDDLSFDLLPVPDHGRLIDADALAEARPYIYSRIMKVNLDLAPTVIPADEEGEG